MRKILAIGNSFSEDATALLHEIAKKDGMETKIVNLSIPSASFETHWMNIISGAAAYDYQLNGDINTGIKISLMDALREDDWEVVTLQQASALSGMGGSYFPYVKNLSAFAKKYAPQAVQLLNQTWAYETDCTHEGFENYQKDQKFMYNSLYSAYLNAARNLKVRVIPCGEIIELLRSHSEFNYATGGQSLCRDGFHIDLTYGRYALAATWYEALLGGNILENTYVPAPQSGSIDSGKIELIKNTIHERLKNSQVR